MTADIFDVTLAAGASTTIVRIRDRRIRPPDPLCVGEVPQYVPLSSFMAMRWCMHLGFRDGVTIFDPTFGGGGFWRPDGARTRSAPVAPPGMTLVTNNLDPRAPTDYHVDYRRTGLPDAGYDVVVPDPPHTGDNGQGGHYADRYGGMAKGNAALIADVQALADEMWRLARVGMVFKVIRSSHGSEWVDLVDAVKAVIPVRPYFELTTVRPHWLPDPKWTTQRVPRNNGAIYVVFRRDSHKHRTFDREYARQLRGGRRGPGLDADSGG